MPKRSSKRPTDINSLAKMIADATTEPEKAPALTETEQRSAAAAMLGRLGGLKGGAARAKALSKKDHNARCYGLTPASGVAAKEVVAKNKK